LEKGGKKMRVGQKAKIAEIRGYLKSEGETYPDSTKARLDKEMRREVQACGWGVGTEVEITFVFSDDWVRVRGPKGYVLEIPADCLKVLQ